MTAATIRDLHTLDELHRVTELEREIWEYQDMTDVVPLPILAVTVKRGGLLLGAFDLTGWMIGFAYSVVGERDGRITQWSHMVGVVREHRSGGVGYRLKLAQRDRCLARRFDLVEWTFDPLQAMNAHFNFAKLGAVAAAYEENIYGESSSPLHRGTPTDRLIAEWWIRSARVASRLERGGHCEPSAGDSRQPAVVLEARGEPLPEAGPVRLDVKADEVAIQIPPDIGTIVSRASETARAWRARTREAFTSYLGRGYLVTDFVTERAAGVVTRAYYVLTAPGSRRDALVR